MKKLPRRLFLSLIFLSAVFLFQRPPSLRAATLRFDQFGHANFVTDQGLILGLVADKGSDDNGGKDSGSSGGSSEGSSGGSSGGTSSQPSANTTTNSQPVSQPATPGQPATETEKRENKTETGTGRERTEMKTKETGKMETEKSRNEMEMKNEEGKLKLETKTATGVFKLEIENGKIKSREETKSGKDNDAKETENGDEATPSAGVEKVEIEESVNLKTTKISALAGQMKIENQGTAALTKLPLSIDSRTNQLIITTANKKTIVATLPSQAIANLISRGLIDSAQNLLDVPSPAATDSAQAEVKAPKTELVERNGEVVYRVVGVKTRKFLNLIPATFNLEAEVNAQTGALVNLQEPAVLRFFGFLFGQ